MYSRLPHQDEMKKVNMCFTYERKAKHLNVIFFVI